MLRAVTSDDGPNCAGPRRGLVLAEAYVLAREIGHHVQHLLGIEQEVSRLQRQDSAGKTPALG